MSENQTRRDFIRVGGMAAFATLYPWLNVFQQDIVKRKSPSDKVRLAFIGIGSRGTGLLHNINAIIAQGANLEIAAVCDNYEPHYQRAIKLTKNPNVKAFYDYRKLLKMDNIDGVIIATPLYEHSHITVDCLEAGLHVFCEKAMARTLDEIKAMYDAHISTGRILQIGLQRMYDPKYIEAVDRIQNGEIGIIGQIRAYWHRNSNWRRPVPPDKPELEKKINWRLYREFSAGLITELASHQIQVANWVLDTPPVSVMGTGSIRYWKDGREVYDNIALIYSYKDGTQFIWDSMTSNRKYGLEEQIMGDIATMELETNKVFLEKPPQAPGIRKLINDIEHSIFDNIPIGGATWVPETAVQYKGEYISEKFEMNETRLQLEAFVKYIRQGRAPEKLTREGYNASIWSILGEEAIDKGLKLEMPTKYII